MSSNTFLFQNNLPAKKTNRFQLECIGACHAYLTLREDFRDQLREVQKHIGFKRIRCHGIFHDLVGVYHSGTKGLANNDIGGPKYNFQNVNKIYDFFLSEGLQPYVELSFMPNALASSDARIFRYDANISPPEDYAQWQNMIEAFVEHCVARYGVDEVRQWYFEVWNEPDLNDVFWSSDQAEYFKLYSSTVDAIRRVDSQLKVGGPSTSKNLWLEDFLSYCHNEGKPVDFVSTHHYCADAALETGSDVFDIAWRGQGAMKADAERALAVVKQSAFPLAELQYTEWNVSPCHEDRFGKDSEFNAVFILETLNDLSLVVDAYSYWCISDIFEESGPGLAPFSGKYGLINIHGVRKPSFHAFHFLSRLYDETLESDAPSTHVSRSQDQHFRILNWNFSEPIETDFGGGDYELENATKTNRITLQDIQGRYAVSSQRVGSIDGNAYRAWQRMGEPRYPTADQIEQLKRAALPKTSTEVIFDCDGELTLEHTLESCEIVFYECRKL